jgi:hypothetical protein
LPVEAKPLFRPDVLGDYLARFQLPPHVDALRPKMTSWAKLLASPAGENLKEKEHFPDFLTLLSELLEFEPRSESPDRWTISREKHVEVDGKVADAVIGLFSPYRPDQFLVAVEGKGSKDPLDRPFAGRRLSAVEQGYRYATNLPCDWIIVSSMRETRLYHKGSDQQTYERFDTGQLAVDDGLLRKFVFLLGRPRMVPLHGLCHLYELRTNSEQVGRKLTHEFYVKYAGIRQDAFLHLCRENPGVAKPQLLQCTQKLLDRILFCAFCEDRNLLPAETIKRAYEHADPYNPRPVWVNFQGLFRWINEGNPRQQIEQYNGGLFKPDAQLDGLSVPDEVCRYFRDLGAYDYRPPHQVTAIEAANPSGGLIDVDILGHIFEQSITDLEKLRLDLFGMAEPVAAEAHKARRKKEGAFYTPAFITRYIVEQALGRVLDDRFEKLRQGYALAAGGKAAAALADPKVYKLDALKKPEREGLLEFWEGWQGSLKKIRVLDPACGSGAFLIQAFDYLHHTHQAVNDRLKELRGHPTIFDTDREILEQNLYGVDLNEEAVEICQLSLWIKTAARGKQLTSLDRTILVGNSVVSDPVVDPKALDWKVAFPEVFKEGGFDVVVGNPPYVRQEHLSSIKPYLETAYQTYHGMADLYVYFYELGLRYLKPGGRLSFVVTNKWMKAGYAEPLRRFFAEQAWIESVVDFGHAKQIFEEADVFPSIIVARKPTGEAKPTTARLCSIPREQLRIDDLSRQIEREGSELPLSQLGSETWQLEPSGVAKLLEKICKRGIPLRKFATVQPLSGIKTGLNEAFLIDAETRKELLARDAKSAEVLKPFLRGQDFCRWNADWAEVWMIVLKSSENYRWPWSESGDKAETVFAEKYPAIHGHLNNIRDAVINRQDQGRYWWELRSCAYWAEFDKPKLMYPEITWRAQWGLDTKGTLCNNTAYFVPTDDVWILAVANSPINWWYSWRTAIHGKDEALRFIKDFVQDLPIPSPTPGQRKSAQACIGRLIHIFQVQQSTCREILDWLRVEHEIVKPSMKLQSPLDLDADAFLAEVKKARGKKKPLTAAAVKNLRDEYTRTIEPARALAAEALTLERQINDLVNEAYGLTPDEIKLMWDTAPPRMPIFRPV